MHSVTSNAVANYIVNSVTSGNMKPVTSNAVYEVAISEKSFYFDSNVDRTNASLRGTAIKSLTDMDYNNYHMGGVGTIRYYGGYYYVYIWGYVVSGTERCALEINPYNLELNIWKYNHNTTTYELKRTI